MIKIFLPQSFRFGQKGLAQWFCKIPVKDRRINIYTMEFRYEEDAVAFKLKFL